MSASPTPAPVRSATLSNPAPTPTMSHTKSPQTPVRAWVNSATRFSVTSSQEKSTKSAARSAMTRSRLMRTPSSKLRKKLTERGAITTSVEILGENGCLITQLRVDTDDEDEDLDFDTDLETEGISQNIVRINIFYDENTFIVCKAWII